MNKKVVYIIGSIVVLSLVVLAVVKLVINLQAKSDKNKLEEQIKENQESIESNQTSQNDLDSEVDNNIEINKPSYVQKVYDSMVTVLYTSMKGAGTYESYIDYVFQKLQNNADFEKLFQTFGKKDGYNLRQWLKGDLSKEDIDTMNKNLRRQGITEQI